MREVVLTVVAPGAFAPPVTALAAPYLTLEKSWRVTVIRVATMTRRDKIASTVKPGGRGFETHE